MGERRTLESSEKKNKENKQPAFLIFEKSKKKSISEFQGKINAYLLNTLLKREAGAANEQSREGMEQRTKRAAISVSFFF